MRLEDELFEFLKHGDEEDQRWLNEAIHAYFDNKPRPEVRDKRDFRNETVDLLGTIIQWLDRDMGTFREENTLKQIKLLATQLRKDINEES